MVIRQICSTLVLKYVQWMLRLHTAVLVRLLTSGEPTARLIESICVYSTQGHMSNHAAFTRAPWVECFPVMQMHGPLYHSWCDFWDSFVLSQSHVEMNCASGQCRRAQVDKQETTKFVDHGFFVLTVFWPSVFGNRVSLNHSLNSSGCWYLWPVASWGGGRCPIVEAETIESFKAQDIYEMYPVLSTSMIFDCPSLIFLYPVCPFSLELEPYACCQLLVLGEGTSAPSLT